MCGVDSLLMKGRFQVVNWNSRTIANGQIIRTNVRITKVSEKNGKRVFEGEIMNLPDDFDAEKVTVTVPVDSQDFPLEQVAGS